MVHQDGGVAAGDHDVLVPRRLCPQRLVVHQDGHGHRSRGGDHQDIVSCRVLPQPAGLHQDGRGEADHHIHVPNRLRRERPDVRQDDDGHHGRGCEVPVGVFVRVDGLREERPPQQVEALFVPVGDAAGDVLRHEGLCGEDQLGAVGDLLLPFWVHRCGHLVCQDAHDVGDAGVPVGVLAPRRDVLEDDHVDDAVHRQGRLFVFVGASGGF